MKRAVFLERPTQPDRTHGRGAAATWREVALWFAFTSLWLGTLVWLIDPLDDAAQRVAILIASGAFGYISLVCWNEWWGRRAIRIMRDEVSFEQFIEGVNRAAARKGYTFKPNDYKSEMAWRRRWRARMTAAEAVADWEDEEP